MTPKRTLSGPYIMKWVTFMVVVVVGLWFLRGLQAAKDAGGVEVRQKPPVVETAPPVLPPEEKPRKKSRPPKLGKEPGGMSTASVPPPVVEPATVQPRETERAPVSQQPQLGVQTEEPTSAKPWIDPADATYVGKVMVCEGRKYDQSTVMGGDGSLNHFYMCLDVGNAFTKVKVDNLFDPVFFSYGGNDFNRAVGLWKNDVVRVRVNDGQALKVEMVRSVKD